LLEASNSYAKQYGEMSRIKQGLGAIGETQISALRAIKPGEKPPTTFEKVIAAPEAALSLASLGLFGFFKGAAKKAGAKAVAQATPKVLDKIGKIWETPKTTPKIVEKIGDVKRTIEETVTDKFAGINAMTSRVRKSLGVKQTPEELNAELKTALIPGIPARAYQMYRDIGDSIRKSLGNVDVEDLNKYLFLRHNNEILQIHPQRAVAGGLTNAELVQGIGDMVQHPQYQKIKQTAESVMKYFNDLLDARVKSGLVSVEQANDLKRLYPAYTPLKYFEELGQTLSSSGKRLSVSSSGLQKLSEMGSELSTIRPLDTIPAATLANEMLIAKNEAAKSILKAAQLDPKLAGQIIKQDIAEQILKATDKTTGVKIPHANKGLLNGTLSYMEDGKKVTYQVPEWLEKEAKALELLPLNQLEKFASSVNAVSRTFLTGANLVFSIGNAAVDALTVMISKQVAPWTLGKRLFLNLKSIIRQDETLRQLRLAGGEMSGFSGKSVDQITKELQKTGNIIIKNPDDWKSFIQNPLKAFEEIGHAVEMSPRTAVFEKGLKAGKSAAEAALESRRATIDFDRAGTLMKHVNAFYLYSNAGLQGAVLPFRTLRDNPASRIALAGFMGSIAGNYAWNRQFPEYDDVPDYAKYGSYIWMIPSNDYDKYGNKVPHYISIIPSLREWQMFSAPLVYAMRKLDKRAPEDVNQMLDSVVPGINPLSQITETGGGIAPPIQASSVLTDMARNTDSFRNQPIVPVELENSPVEEQYNEYTSESAVRVGKFLGISPMKLDYALKGIFGGLGKQILSAADAVVNKISPEDVPPKIADLYAQLSEIKPPNVDPENVTKERNNFLYKLSAEDREAVLQLERKPEEQIPFITPMLRKVYRESGGQLYKTGQALAEKETGYLRNKLRKLVEYLERLTPSYRFSKNFWIIVLSVGISL
jgi:hypothetical protein